MSTPQTLPKGFRAKWRWYKKAYVAGSGGAILAALAALDHAEVVASQPWVSAVVSTATAVGVYQVKNELPAELQQEYIPVQEPVQKPETAGVPTAPPPEMSPPDA